MLLAKYELYFFFKLWHKPEPGQGKIPANYWKLDNHFRSDSTVLILPSRDPPTQGTMAVIVSLLSIR